MAQNETFALAEDTYTLLTAADTGVVTLSNNSASEPIYLIPTTDDTEPTDLDGAIVLKAGDRIVNTDLEELFPGLAGVDRLWAFAHDPGASIMISAADNA